MAWVTYDSFRPGSLPYSRVLIEKGAPEKFPNLVLKQNSEVAIHKYEIKANGVKKSLAEFHVAFQNGKMPVPLSWRSKLAEPIFIADANPEDTKKIANTLAKHLPKDAIVLSWWDISRRLKFYQNIPAIYSEAKADPIFVPEIWTHQVGLISQQERAFWEHAPTAKSQQDKFRYFVDALLKDIHTGIDDLRKIGKGKPVFLVLNLLDAYKVGTLASDRLGIGFKDFARSKQSHGLIKGVKAWVKENGYTAYSVFPVDKSVIRIFFLTDKPSKHTLIAQLLPFDSSNPSKLSGAKLVYQYRGYWVYELQTSDQKTPAN